MRSVFIFGCVEEKYAIDIVWTLLLVFYSNFGFAFSILMSRLHVF